jgi:hypothetical protein
LAVFVRFALYFGKMAGKKIRNFFKEKTLALPCITLPIFLTFGDGFLILNTGFEPQKQRMNADIFGRTTQSGRAVSPLTAVCKRQGRRAAPTGRRSAASLPVPICVAKASDCTSIIRTF